jgi:hypothetical protein
MDWKGVAEGVAVPAIVLLSLGGVAIYAVCRARSSTRMGSRMQRACQMLGSGYTEQRETTRAE